MTTLSPHTALKAITSWWDTMGVPGDPAILRALERASKTHPTPSDSPTNGQAPPPTPLPAAGADTANLAARIAQAETAAARAATLAALAEEISAYDGCPLKQGAKNAVVFDGCEGAPILVLGEGPGADEDRQGKPFVGRAGQLLDKMLAAIRLDRASNVLISNVNYWRPPRNRNPEAEELAVCRPFVDRLIDLTAPKLIITAGAVPSQSLLSVTTGIMRLRGREQTYATPSGAQYPLIPILHPAFLLRRPQEKSRAWRDLQTIAARADQLGVLRTP